MTQFKMVWVPFLLFGKLKYFIRFPSNTKAFVKNASHDADSLAGRSMAYI